MKEVEGLSMNLKRFYTLPKEYYVKEIKEPNNLDKWLISKLQKAIKETREALERLQTRRAVNAAFFEMMNNIKWYIKRGGDNLAIIFDEWLKLLAPFTPHICEEIWHWRHNSFISLEKYPEYDSSKINEVVEAEDEYLKALIDDIKEILKFVEKPKVIYLATTENWKKEIAEIVLKSEGKKEIMGEILKNEKFKKYSKQIPKLVAKICEEVEEHYLIIDEKKVIEENTKFIEKEVGIKVELNPEKVPEKKKIMAIPGKPAIYVEAE